MLVISRLCWFLSQSSVPRVGSIVIPQQLPVPLPVVSRPTFPTWSGAACCTDCSLPPGSAHRMWQRLQGRPINCADSTKRFSQMRGDGQNQPFGSPHHGHGCWVCLWPRQIGACWLQCATGTTSSHREGVRSSCAALPGHTAAPRPPQRLSLIHI